MAARLTSSSVLKKRNPERATASAFHCTWAISLKSPWRPGGCSLAIQSTAAEHREYQRILHEISARYGVGRLVVSSLVGHSLDALATGIPAIQVLHDFFPLWPLLGIHPEPFLAQGHEHALAAALRQHQLLPGFRNLDAEGWSKLGRQWREAVEKWGIRIAAPSRSVAGLIRKLDPAWTSLDIQIIPHGLPELPGGRRDHSP